MATENWPSGDPAFRLLQYDEGLEWNVQISAGRAGNVTTRSLPGIRWLGALYIPPETVANDIYRGRVEALIAKLDGGENRLAMFNLARPMPNGTLRGSPTISGSHVTGASSIVLANCTGSDNLLIRQSEFDHSYWTKNNLNAPAANATTAPDGTVTAEKITETTANAGHSFSRSGITSDPAVTHTFSLYAKAAERRYIRLHIEDGTNHVRAVFDVLAGAITETITSGTGSGVVASIVNVGSGWFRCVVSGIPDTGGGSAVQVQAYMMATATGTAVYTGDGTSGLYAWGAQLAVGSKAYPFAAGATLLRGDRISAAGQRFLVAADAMADSAGAMTVQVRPRVRVALAGGEAVVWDKPTSLFIPTTPRVMFPYKADQRPGFAIEVAEVWA